MQKLFFFYSFFIILSSCNNNSGGDQAMMMSEDEMEEEMNPSGEAQITEVTFTKNGNDYTFSVRITSPDTGCDQYANWWEVITADGDLIYRRILGHSHVNEQPFTRSGGPVSITEDQELIIRGHMNNSGYGTAVFKGSISDGFTKTTIEKDFAKELAEQQPLPTNCAF